ncbi:hypothetical protein HK105_207347 [Polyrhizophydium stewartii]|uniref:Pentacotripeptide-repeat region of PRORP domain-containing protein n=1 Tax=Polyrhizophydium stewartii TaxID=2732419 RepID=A0ABR4N0Y2_9FUNG
MQALGSARAAAACVGACGGAVQRVSAQRAASSALGSINKQVTGAIKLRPAVTRLSEHLGAETRMDRYGVFDHTSWFEAPAGDAMAAARVLDNALKAGTDVQVLRAYGAVRELGASALGKVSHRSFQTLLERVQASVGARTVATEASSLSAHFGGLTGTAVAELAFQVREDYLASEHAPSIEMDVAVLRLLRHVEVEEVSTAVQAIKAMTQDWASVDAAKGTGDGDGSGKGGTRTSSFVTAETCNEIVSVFAASGQVDVCKAVIARMLELGITADVETFCRLVVGQCNAGDVAGAEELAEQIYEHGSKEQVRFVRESLLRAHAQQGNVSQAHKYFDAIGRAAAAAGEASTEAGGQTTGTYNSLLLAFAERGLPGDVTRTYRRMRQAQVEGDAETYVFMIRGYGRAGDATSAARAYRRRTCKGSGRRWTCTRR